LLNAVPRSSPLFCSDKYCAIGQNLKWYAYPITPAHGPEVLNMLRLLFHWVINALAVWITSRVVPGFLVEGMAAALIAVLIIGLINATLGLFLKIITFPLTIATLGIFWLIINAFMLKLAAAFVPGFHIRGFAPAFWGGIVLSLINLLLRWLVLPS
jgi:putative membrane protein